MSDNIVLYKDRLIAFLDVLGFSSKLQTEDLFELHKKYSEFIDLAKNEVLFGAKGDKSGRTNFEYSQFVSDSIILVSNSIVDPYNVNNFLGAVSILMQLGFTHHYPLRGSITRGDVLYDHDREIFLSDTFPDAVKFEGFQELVCCSVLERAENIVLNSVSGINNIADLKNEKNDLIHRYAIPMKNNEIKEMLLVNYTFSFSQDEIMPCLENLIEPKKTNTKNYQAYIDQLPQEYQPLSDDFLPAKYVSVMKTRTGMRVAFLDENLCRCEPGVKEFMMKAVWVRPDLR